MKEDNLTEFKSSFSDAVIETLVAFAFRGRYYKRVNNSNHQLSVLEITDLNLQSLQISWDSCVAHSKTLADLDFKKIEVFFDKVKNAGRFVLEGSVLESLEKLRLIKGQLITNAAWLLFGKESTGYNVHLGRFKTPSHIIDDKMQRNFV
jgi:ATP-dependent DNA helicase RecG